MNKQIRTSLWIAIFFAIVLGMVWQFYPLPDALARIDSLPLIGKNFIGKNVPLSDFEKNFFKGINLIKRDYNIGNQTFFIIALDGTHNRHVVHDPYYCFRGMGWTILQERTIEIPGGQAAILNIEKGGVQKEAMFWFSSETERYISPLRYWWQATLRRLTLGRSGPEPILIMVQPINQTPVDWNQLPELFPQLFEI